jgi:RNA recognition motif-containing protein
MASLSPSPSPHLIYVYQLPKHCGENELDQVFSIYGKIDSLNLLHTNPEKPYATIKYQNPADAATAKSKLHGCVFMGRKIK